jgi:signal transduction histidine kinase/ligand-binding sensor domain-containing protein/AraC-like DNA-binding protein/AmiR/NasT family two-component response regulator
MNKNLLVLTFLTCCLCHLFPQSRNMSGGKEYGIGELSSYLINKFVQDSYGYIWIATDYGLNKYDGIRFTHYLNNEHKGSSLLSNNVKTLMIDKSHTLWVGCNNGLQYYKPDEDSFETILFPNRITPHVSNIIQLHDGEIWATTSGWGVYSIDKKNKLAHPLRNIIKMTDPFISYMYEDKDNNLWFGVDSKGLIRVNKKTYKSKVYSYPEISHNAIAGMVEDGTGRLYMSTAASVYYYDKPAQRFIPVKSATSTFMNILNIISTKNNTIYVGTNGKGLHYIDKQSNRLVPVSAEDPLLNYYLPNAFAIMEDKDLNLWIGGFQRGILLVPNQPKQFNFFAAPTPQNGQDPIINSIVKDPDGNVFYSIKGLGIYKTNDHSNSTDYFTQINDIVKLYIDSHGMLWGSSYTKGIAKIDKKTGQASFLDIPYNSYGKTLVEGKNNCLYVSTFSSGFIQYNLTTGKCQRFDMQQPDKGKGKLDNNWINSILCDSEGLVWLGHYKGISCYNPKDGRFLKIKNKDILKEGICITLKESRDGHIWIGTYNGLFFLNKKTGDIKRYTIENGLSSNVICGIAEDKSGNMWCSTFKGIDEIKRKENKIINYFTGNGLVDKIYNRWVYFQDKDGTIYFGSNRGITYFKPEKISIPALYDYRIKTTNVYVNNQSVNSNTLSGKKQIVKSGVLDSNEFSFSYEDNTFTFEFSTMDYRDQENIIFEYKIKELGKEWLSTRPGVNQITYHNLPPGKYTLEVRASKYGFYSPVKQLILRISPPWYKSAWAYLVYTMIIASIGVLIVNLIREKRNEMINESKLRFFINISHELRSPLTLLVSPLEKLLQGNFDQPTQKNLQRMQRNVYRLLGLVNQILDIRKIDKGQMKLKYTETEIVGFVQEVFEVFEEQSIRRNIHFQYRHQMEALQVWVDRNNFDKILINLLSNSFKYTPDGGEIIISLKTGTNPENRWPLRNYLEISITDSGIGLDEDKIHKIFDRFYQGQNQETFTTVGSGIGLNLTKFLVHLHQGTIVAQNRKDKRGSIFTVSIPSGKEHLTKEDVMDQLPDSRPTLLQNRPIQESKNESKIIKRKTNYKVLIVDDEEDITNYLEQELNEAYKVIKASNGFDALQLATTLQPDLIISDVLMPQMDGITLVRKIKNNNNVCHIPVILLTSKTEFEDKVEGLDKGADAYLTKPFNIDEMMIVANNLITNRRILRGKYSGEQEQNDKIKSMGIKSNNDMLMDRIMAVVNENIGNPDFNVEVLASKAGLSRVQLHRKMKEITGFSTIDFIKNIRMKQASMLLEENGMDVSQAAYAVGFTNQTHFSTVFKKFYGVSPSEYANQHKKSKN